MCVFLWISQAYCKYSKVNPTNIDIDIQHISSAINNQIGRIYDVVHPKKPPKMNMYQF